MGNISLELDCAKAILKTYHQVNDTHVNQTRTLKTMRSQVEPMQVNPENGNGREKELENEVRVLKEKYAILQHELSDRDERLARLNRALQEGSSHMARLEEDYENVIYQLQRNKIR